MLSISCLHCGLLGHSSQFSSLQCLWCTHRPAVPLLSLQEHGHGTGHSPEAASSVPRHLSAPSVLQSPSCQGLVPPAWCPLWYFLLSMSWGLACMGRAVTWRALSYFAWPLLYLLKRRLELVVEARVERSRMIW